MGVFPQKTPIFLSRKLFILIQVTYPLGAMQMQETRAIRFQELHKKVGASRSTISRWEKQGIFPRRFSLGKNSVAWLLSDVEKWLLTRANGEK